MNTNTTRSIIGSILALGLWLPTALASEKPAPQLVSGKINWVYDYDDARQISLASNKPMFVVFRCER